MLLSGGFNTSCLGAFQNPKETTMAINAKFFASLRESLGLDESSVNLSDVHTVADVWKHATHGAKMPPNTLMALNMEYVPHDHPVKDGDEVAFFPPVSGG
jgi:molybdopterin synthase sulfur carrier subunit